MAKEIKDVAASVKARLIGLAKENREEAQSVFIRYGVERFLYRLSRSQYRDKFLLKGAALFTLWFNHPHRPTKDIDLLGYGDIDIPTLENHVREICGVKCDDGLKFDEATVRGEPIREDDAYQGVRIKLATMLGTARIPVQIDVGSGDAVTPAAKTATMPTMLQMPAATLKVYPKETVVAEKFEAMVRFGLANSRMKDLWDLDYLIREFDFDGTLLQRALKATFENRRTVLPMDLPVALTNDFAVDDRIRSLWSGFVSRNGIETSTEIGNVIENLREFFLPIINAQASNDVLSKEWKAGKKWEQP